MTASSQHEITRLLVDYSGGDKAALDQLMPLVYDELRRLAHSYLRRERPGHTLQTTALVNEAYLRLIDQHRVEWQNRAHFFGIAAQLMRRILVDHARSRHADKRGGAARHVPLDEAVVVSAQRAAEVLALDEAMTALSALDERTGRTVEMRFFCGLSIVETAAVLAVSPGTVMRDWTLAKAWLHREISKRA